MGGAARKSAPVNSVKELYEISETGGENDDEMNKMSLYEQQEKEKRD